jgi:hypothetical protein
MNRAQPGVGQRQPAKQAGYGHVLTRSGIAAILEGRPQRTRGAAHAFQAEGIRYWVRARADIRLDELRQRVEAGAGRDGRRQIVGEFRVNERDPREERRAAQADFHSVLRRGEHGVARGLGTCACRCGNRNERS